MIEGYDHGRPAWGDKIAWLTLIYFLASLVVFTIMVKVL